MRVSEAVLGAIAGEVVGAADPYLLALPSAGGIFSGTLFRSL